MTDKQLLSRMSANLDRAVFALEKAAPYFAEPARSTMWNIIRASKETLKEYYRILDKE